MEKTCAACGRNIPEFSRACEYCGQSDAVPPSLPSFDQPFEPSDEDLAALESFDFEPESAPQAPAPATATASLVPDSQEAPKPRSRRLEVMVVMGALIVGGALTLVMLTSRGGAQATVAAAPVAAAPASAATTAHRRGWSTANASVWAADRKGIAFELEAENMVSIWMRSVRPMLVVRCAAGMMEAFVFTASATKIEPQTDDHTVKFKFDDGAEMTERWPDSEEHDALFAPDGAVFAQKAALARTLHFSFTPHNAGRVTAEFNVAGLAELIAPASKQCGWMR
jgi:hypothetical protein